MKYLTRIAGLCLIVLILTGLFGCQSAPYAPASVSQSLKQEDLSPTSVAVSENVPSVASAQNSSIPNSSDFDKLSTRPKPSEVGAIPTSSNPLPTAIAGTDLKPQVAQPQFDNLSTSKVSSANPKPTAPAVPASPFNDADLYLHVPSQINQSQPARVLLVLHGMGGQGAPFSQALLADADKNNWIIVAPNLPYRDYMDLTKLKEDDLALTKRVADTLDSLPKRLNLKLRQHVLVYGFSRGAQLGHRFAMMYPEYVGSVATISAGSYTLPQETKSADKGASRLPFPFGTGDFDKLLGHSLGLANLKHISFWVAVGDKDNCSTDVPRDFDQYIGENRVERARIFEQALVEQGIFARLVIFPNVGHEVTGEMRKGALQFLRERETIGFTD